MKILGLKMAVAVLFAVCIAILDNLTGYPYDKISHLQNLTHSSILILAGIVIWNVGEKE